jgi:hemoglobin
MLGILIIAAGIATLDPVRPGEQPVDPYVHSDANAGASPAADKGLWHAFHEQPGVDRIVDDFVDRNAHDPVIGNIFEGQDLVRLRRTLKEQFCYLLGGGCSYSGRDMAAAHKDLGVQMKDMNVLVANLQQAMDREGVSFFAQNRLLAKLAPMKHDIVTH